MTALVWDEIDERSYQAGTDRGVLYPSNGDAVVWNGLTSVVEVDNNEVEAVYFDGLKIHDFVTNKDYSAEVTALTYPEQLDSEVRLELSNQPKKSYGFSYRTMINNEDYKLHIVFNAIFIPSDIAFESVGSNVEPIEFEWDLVSPRIEVEGFAPIADIVIDSRYVDPLLMEELEGVLYGTVDTDPELLPIDQFLVYLREWARIVIVDNGDGTWTAMSVFPDYIYDLGGNEFQLDHVNATYLDADTYEVSSTSLETET